LRTWTWTTAQVWKGMGECQQRLNGSHQAGVWLCIFAYSIEIILTCAIDTHSSTDLPATLALIPPRASAVDNHTQEFWFGGDVFWSHWCICQHGECGWCHGVEHEGGGQTMWLIYIINIISDTVLYKGLHWGLMLAFPSKRQSTETILSTQSHHP
jgi:hypothetical protein